MAEEYDLRTKDGVEQRRPKSLSAQGEYGWENAPKGSGVYTKTAAAPLSVDESKMSDLEKAAARGRRMTEERKKRSDAEVEESALQKRRAGQ